jgi:hypothetical protein
MPIPPEQGLILGQNSGWSARGRQARSMFEIFISVTVNVVFGDNERFSRAGLRYHDTTNTRIT